MNLQLVYYQIFWGLIMTEVAGSLERWVHNHFHLFIFLLWYANLSLREAIATTITVNLRIITLWFERKLFSLFLVFWNLSYEESHFQKDKVTVATARVVWYSQFPFPSILYRIFYIPNGFKNGFSCNFSDMALFQSKETLQSFW